MACSTEEKAQLIIRDVPEPTKPEFHINMVGFTLIGTLMAGLYVHSFVPYITVLLVFMMLTAMIAIIFLAEAAVRSGKYEGEKMVYDLKLSKIHFRHDLKKILELAAESTTTDVNDWKMIIDPHYMGKTSNSTFKKFVHATIDIRYGDFWIFSITNDLEFVPGSPPRIAFGKTARDAVSKSIAVHALQILRYKKIVEKNKN